MEKKEGDFKMEFFREEDLGRAGRRMKRQEIETKHGDKAQSDRNPQI